MKARFLFASPALVSSIVFASPQITGGKAVQSIAEEIPSIVRLGPVPCAGAIVNRNWVVTVAHCAAEVDYVISNFTDTAHGRHYRIKNVVIHPQREPRFDLALIELLDPLPLGDRAHEIQLATPEFEKQGQQAEGMMAAVYGWGLTSENPNDRTPILLKAIMPLVSAAKANERDSYGGDVDPNSMIAAGYAQGGVDACQGDSGGPLIVLNKTTFSPTLVGLVSWGEGCGRPHKYGVYAKISAAYDWIQKTIK